MVRLVLATAVAAFGAAIATARTEKTGFICHDVADGCTPRAAATSAPATWGSHCGPNCMEIEGKALTVVFPRGAFVDYGVSHPGVVTVKAPSAKVYWR